MCQSDYLIIEFSTQKKQFLASMYSETETIYLKGLAKHRPRLYLKYPNMDNNVVLNRVYP